jgi:hypothetical protein
MEIIAVMIVYALAEDIKENKATMVDLQEQIVELNDDFLRLSGAHSSLYAQHKLDHDTHHAKIDANTKKINGLIDTLEESLSSN